MANLDEGGGKLSAKPDAKTTGEDLLVESLKPVCGCLATKSEGRKGTAQVEEIPYSHMGHAKDLDTLRKTFSEACDVPESRIRIVEVEKVSLGITIILDAAIHGLV